MTNIVKFAGFEIKTLAEFKETCRDVCNSSMIPKHYCGKPNDVMIAWEMGMGLGLNLMQSLAGIYVVNGIANVWGDTLLALAMQHPSFESMTEDFDEETETATCTVKRKGKGIVVNSFSRNDAITAKLWGKEGSWTTHPKRMLKLKARNFSLRDQFADLLKGLKIREEVIEYETIEKDITPPFSEYSETVELPAINSPAEFSPHSELSALIYQHKIANETIEIWFNRANVKSISELSNDFCKLLIDGINKKYGDVNANSDA